MKNLLRNILIAVGILVAVLIAVPFLVSPNQFRPTIEEKLSAALGRQVKVGNMGFSLLSGSLAAEDLVIADDPEFSKSAFLKAQSLKVGVEVIPLIFSRSLHVTGIKINQPEVILLRNREGRWNFSSFGSTAGSTSAKQAAGKRSGSGGASDLVVKELELSDGRLTVGSTNSAKRSVYDHLNLEASDVSMTSQFPVKLSVKLPGGGSLKLNGKVGPINDGDAALSPLEAELKINGMDLGASGFLDPDAGLGGQMDCEIALLSKDGKAHAKGNLRLERLQAARGGAPSSVPINIDLDSNYDLRRSAGALNQGSVKIGNAVAHLAGTFESRGEATILNMKLEGQSMPVQDLQAVLPAVGVVLPKGASLQQGTMSVNLNAQGPSDRLVTTGNVGLYNARLAGFDLSSKMAALSAFTGMKSSSDTSIEKLTTNLRAAPEGIQTSDLNLVMPALGTLTGNGTISSSNALNFKMLAELSSSNGVTTALSGLTGSGKGSKIPFMIQGTTSDPKFVPDVGGIVGSQLGNLLGGKSKAGNSPTQGLADALGGLFGKKKNK